jgi:predicted ester cyclase
MNLLDNHRQSVIYFNRQDAAATAEVYAENAVIHDPQHPEPIRGRAAVRRDYEALFGAFPDIRTSVIRVLIDGRHIAYHMILRGTHDGPLAVPSGELPPTAREIELPAAVFAEADDRGRYVVVQRFYDVAALLQQVSAIEETT